MTWMLLDIPLMVLFFGLMAGIPMWLVLEHPDRQPAVTAAPGVTRMPARQYAEPEYRRVA